MRAIAPQKNWDWLRRIQRKHLAAAKARDKRPSMATIEELVELGITLMGESEKENQPIDTLTYRDGLNHRPSRQPTATALEFDRAAPRPACSAGIDRGTDKSGSSRDKKQTCACLLDTAFTRG